MAQMILWVIQILEKLIKNINNRYLDISQEPLERKKTVYEFKLKIVQYILGKN